jgi:hypothetical protein
MELKVVQSFENENMISENTCEAIVNDVMEKYETNPSLHIESSQILQSEEKTMTICDRK